MYEETGKEMLVKPVLQLTAGQLAREHGFVDVDVRRPTLFDLQ
jgi:hypothetical protein